MAEEESKPRLKKTPEFKVVLNLRAFPFAEEMVHECEDGERREGIFIPYEVEGQRYVYRNDKYSYFNIYACVDNIARKYKAGSRPNTTHVLHPYWTKEQEAKMKDLGYEKRSVFLGNMSILRWSNWVTRVSE